MPFYDARGNWLTSLSETACIAQKQIIQIAGAGGKTTLTAVLAAENRDKKVCVTTTTKRYRPDDKTYVTREGERLTSEQLKKAECRCVTAKSNAKGGVSNATRFVPGDERSERTCGYVEAGQYVTERKVCYPGKENLTTLIRWADLTLIEADGSRRLPLKCVYPHEPVFVQEIFGGLSLNPTEHQSKSVFLKDVFAKNKNVNPSTISLPLLENQQESLAENENITPMNSELSLTENQEEAFAVYANVPPTTSALSLTDHSQQDISIPVKTIIVAGLNAIGLKMRDACYGYELVSDHIQADEVITPQIIAYLLKRFFLEPFEALCPQVILSHANTPERMRAGIQVFNALKHSGILMDVSDIGDIY